MSTPSPRRRHSSAVYRRRRLVLLVVLLIVVGVVLAIWRPWRHAAPATPHETSTAVIPAPTGAGSATPTDPAPSPTSAATDAGTPPATPRADATPATCTAADVTVKAVTDKQAYAAGEDPKLSITLANTSSASCLINVGTTQQSFVITSGTDTWWRSTDCQSEQADQLVTLAAGQTVSSASPLTWDRTRSKPETCNGDRQKALPGYYQLKVTIGGVPSTGAAVFRLL